MVVEQDRYKTLIKQTQATQWTPGQSGNPAGRPISSVTTLLKNKGSEDNQAIADKLYSLALSGDMPAIKEYIDRTEGKVIDKHLSIHVEVTPESIQVAQGRLVSAQKDTYELTGQCPVCGAKDDK